MAGSDQSVNLGGMLSQMGGAFGKGIDATKLNRNIQNMGRPDADPTNPDSLRGLMNWQQKLGRTDEARLTQMNINQAEERAKEERTKREGQARAMAISQYEKALQGGDENAIAAAEDAVRKVGEAQGIDVTGLLAGVEQRSFNKTNQQFQAEERKRVAQERAKAEAEKEQANKLAVSMNSATTIEELDQILENAAPEIAGQANILYERATTRVDKAQARAEAEAEARAPLRTVELALPETGIPDGLRTSFSKRVDGLNQRIEDLNKRIAKGEAVNPKIEKQNLEAERRALENRMYQMSDRVALDEYGRSQDKERKTESDIRALEVSKRAPFTDDAAILKEARILAGVDDKGNQIPPNQDNWTQAKRRLIRERNNAIDNQIRYLSGEEPEAEPIEEGDGGFSVNVNGKVTTAAMVSDAVAAIGEAATRAKLKAQGISDGQIEALLGNVRGGYGPSGMDRVREGDRAKVERIRSKVSPMGTYTQ